MKHIRIDMKLRNNRILSLMEERGINSVAELCRLMKCPSKQTDVGRIINFKLSPLKKNPENEADKWLPIAHKLAEFLGVVDPEDLFPEEVQGVIIPNHTKIFVELNSAELKALSGRTHPAFLRAPQPDPEKALQQQELNSTLEKSLSKLTFQEQLVIRRRFGLHGDEEETLEEIASSLGVTREWIRQLEMKAMRRLRHPVNSRPIEAAGGRLG